MDSSAGNTIKGMDKEITSAGSIIKGFVISGKSKVSYFFVGKRNLIVKVKQVYQDDFETDSLLIFLKWAGVISDVEGWAVESVDDMEGCTLLVEEIYTTVGFVVKA